MRTTLDIFKITETPVIVKTAVSSQALSCEAAEKKLEQLGFTACTDAERSTFSSFLAPDATSPQPQRVAEPPPAYKTLKP